MRILVVNTFYYPDIEGGAEIVAQKLCEELSKLGHEVFVLTLSEHVEIHEIINGVHVFRVKTPNIYYPYFRNRKKPKGLMRKIWHLLDTYNLISPFIMKRYIKKISPDVILMHKLTGWSTSIWNTAKKFKIPSIQVLHDLYFMCQRNMFKFDSVCKKQCWICKIQTFLNKVNSSNVTAVVGVSKFILEHHTYYGYFKDVQFKKVIYNSYEPENQTQNKTDDSNFINLGFLGTLAPNKGIEHLLRIFSRLSDEKAKLLVGGRGEPSFEEYLKRKYSSNKIIFLGYVKPRDFFQKIDACIVPSRWFENFPGVVLESLSYGVPVIASKIGGIPEIVTEGINGLLFDPYVDSQLEKAIRDFINNIELWRSKKNQIRQSIKRFQSVKSWVTEWEKFIVEVINQRQKDS